MLSELSEVLWEQLLRRGYTLNLLSGQYDWLNTVLQVVVVFVIFAGWAGMCSVCALCVGQAVGAC